MQNKKLLSAKAERKRWYFRRYQTKDDGDEKAIWKINIYKLKKSVLLMFIF